MPFEGLSAEDIVVLVQCKLCSFPMESAYIHPSVFYDVDINVFFHLWSKAYVEKYTISLLFN